jgi:hypothetical protein
MAVSIATLKSFAAGAPQPGTIRRIGVLFSLVAAIALFVSCDGSISAAIAAPSCPGQLTSDGLACCAPGSMPTGDDTCQLAAGGQAASCTLGQLTSGGTCCPPSSSPQSDGTCQSNGYTVQGCPLGQLDKGGLTCCPAGQTPQADGSCQQAAAATPATPAMPAGISACPNGFVFQPQAGGCTGMPIGCPSPPTNVNGATLSVPSTPLAGTPTLGAVSNPGYTLGCCPYPSGQLDPSSSCQEGGRGTLVTIAPLAPICPPGSVANNFFDSGIYVCVEAAACPVRFHVDQTSGMCDLNPIDFTANAVSEALQLNDRGSCGSGFVPRRAFTGDLVCVSPLVGAQTILDNISAPSRIKPDGNCVQGYVWRQAVPSDHVCVTPTTRTQVQLNNKTGVQIKGTVQQQVTPPQSGFTPPLGTGQSGATTTAVAPAKGATVGVGNPKAESVGNGTTTVGSPKVESPGSGATNKGVTPPKLNIATPTPKITVTPPKLNIAKPPPPALKLPTGTEEKEKR